VSSRRLLLAPYIGGQFLESSRWGVHAFLQKKCYFFQNIVNIKRPVVHAFLQKKIAILKRVIRQLIN
jgi:hypothetical protein